jgi:hypothetical protein
MTDEYKVVETEDGWIIDGTDIVKGSRASAYRAKKKFLLDLSSQPEPLIDDTVQEAIDEETETFVVEEPEAETFSEEVPTDETSEPETFSMPTLESLSSTKQEGGGGSSSKTDDSFLKAFKSAEIKTDKNGNPKIHISSIWQGASPVISTILEFGDNSIESWAKTEGVVAWNPTTRASQRAMFVRVLGIIAPKTDVSLDPTQVVLMMVAWMYGLPVFKIMSSKRKRKKALKEQETEEGEVEYLD